MIAIMIADLDILQKKHRSFCVIISLWPFQPTVTLSKDLPKEITVVKRQKGAMTWTIWTQKITELFQGWKVPPFTRRSQRPLRDYMTTTTKDPLGYSFKQKTGPIFLGIGSISRIDQPSSREAFRLPKTNIFETWKTWMVEGGGYFPFKGWR